MDFAVARQLVLNSTLTCNTRLIGMLHVIGFYTASAENDTTVGDVKF